MFEDKMKTIEKQVTKGKSEKVIKYLKDHNGEVRLAAIKGLGRIGDETAFNTLLSILQSSDPQQRIVTAGALGVCGNMRGAVSFLSHKLQYEKDNDVIIAYRKAIVEIKNGSKK